MAAIIHRDPFEILIRKIGFSVGLEATRERVAELTERYATQRALSLADWSAIVREKWNLKTGHITKVFSELNLIRVQAGGLDVLYGLDALAIVWLRIGRARFAEALDSVLTALFLIADADVFLNCLVALFEPVQCKVRLIKMIQDKREQAYKAIRLTALREKVDRVINIEVQRSNRGGAVAGIGLASLTRKEALEAKGAPLLRPANESPQISDDYLRKVPPRRRDWARSVGLFGDEIMSPRGELLLRELTAAKCQLPNGGYTLWPFEPELARLHLTPATAPWPTVSFSELAMLLGRVFSGRAFEPDPEKGSSWLREVYDTYVNLNEQKALLRKELPLRVAYLVQLGASASGNTAADIQAVLRGAASDVQLRTSRHHEGSLVFRS